MGVGIAVLCVLAGVTTVIGGIACAAIASAVCWVIGEYGCNPGANQLCIYAGYCGCDRMNGKYVLIFFIAAFSLGLILSYIDGHLELLEILRSFAVAL
ncbi:MAG: halocin C8-like domain-containing protein, partial [Archaeoglobaceae archaeon]